jgi:ATP-dependent RNA helicase DDX54/DBP10
VSTLWRLPRVYADPNDPSIIATPGRLLHLIVEMNLDLRAIQYCVFDEADRLFELGFEQQLHEILHRMPPTRQTLLFSATLPSSLVGFAKAGLQNPKLIRLDVDSKISKELQMAYLSVKGSEKEAMLLSVLREVIGVPLMSDEQRRLKDEYIEDEEDDEDRGGRKAYKGKGKKRKRGTKEEEAAEKAKKDEIDPTAHQTLVFVSTKHHVEYIAALLAQSGYAVSPIYGSMDQTARRLHLAKFRAGRTSILVVTDLAARGIDIPGVENVVNYDFPNGARSFVHRVGRTARAGRKGWAYTFVTASELPHLLDLELFLGRTVATCPLPPTDDAEEDTLIDYSNQLVLGTAPRALLDLDLETFRSMMSHHNEIDVLGNVARRGQKMYERGISKASPESYRRAKQLQIKGKGLAANAGETDGTHPVFGEYAEIVGLDVGLERQRAELMKVVNAFRPGETVFEIGTRGKTPAAILMSKRREAMGKSERARKLAEIEDEEEEEMPKRDADEDEDERVRESKRVRVVDQADDEELAVSPRPYPHP